MPFSTSIIVINILLLILFLLLLLSFSFFPFWFAFTRRIGFNHQIELYMRIEILEILYLMGYCKESFHLQRFFFIVI